MLSGSIEQQMVVAYREGLSAARAGQVRASNPHDPGAETAVERVLALMWVRGYGVGNPVEDDADIDVRVPSDKFAVPGVEDPDAE